MGCGGGGAGFEWHVPPLGIRHPTRPLHRAPRGPCTHPQLDALEAARSPSTVVEGTSRT